MRNRYEKNERTKSYKSITDMKMEIECKNKKKVRICDDNREKITFGEKENVQMKKLKIN